jgi:transposase
MLMDTRKRWNHLLTLMRALWPLMRGLRVFEMHERELHLILDNYAPHKHPKVKVWVAKHPRFHLYFTPSSASRLNTVERFFRDLTAKRLHRGVFHRMPELAAALEKYPNNYNEDPAPFVRTAKANDLPMKVKRARKKLSRHHKAL